MNSQSDEKLGYRVLIEGTLTTKTFLHIGSDKPIEEVAAAKRRRAEAPAQADGEPAEKDTNIPLPVVTGGKDKDSLKAIIPASALRGALRSRLKKYGLDEDLMGRAAEPGGQDSPVHGKARRVFVHDATIVESSLQGLDFDNRERCVDEIAMTAISRWRRAPQDEMLRSVEAVPPEVTFNVRVGICGDPAKEVKERVVTRDEVAKVLAALGHCDWRQDSAGSGAQTPAAQPLFKPLQLGAFQKAGWGKVEWKTCKVTALTSEGLTTWLGSKQNPVSDKRGWELCSEPIGEKSFVRPEPPDTLDNVIHLPLTLAFESTFFTVDQRQHTRDAVIREAKAAKQRDEDYPEKLAKVMRVNGRAWLSGQSLKGALRSQVERILRTKGIYCCDPSLKEEDWPEEKKTKFHTGPCCPPIRSASEIGKLCFACQVFGNGGWASTIEVSSFGEVPEYTKNTRREFLAISRFTGGGVPKLKFSADVAVHPKLSGTIRINIDRLLRLPDCDAKFGALLHLFRDFAEGDIPVGAGRSKGFGAFSLRLEDRREPGGNHLDFEQALRLILQKAEQIGSEKAAIAFSGTLEKEAHGWLNAFDSTPEKQTEWVHPEWWKPAATPQPQSLPEEPLPAKVLGRFNPYHWVPVAHSPNCLSINADSLSSKHTHRHDNYAADGYSGRITVRIRAVTPLFVGGLRERTPSERQAGLVKHYCVGGVPAIPSTSLRGLLSSTYEIATASAMRVLDANKIYSYRMPASSRFHSIGRVAEGGSKIIPWNQRPTGRQYTEGSGVPKQLKNLPVWNEIPQTDPLGTGQSVPDFYCLDFGGRHKHMPIGNNGRSHEICLTRPNSEPQRIEITGGALEQFYRIADERTKETKDESDPCPYEPQGQRPQGRKDDDLFYRLKDNDFVYFKAELVNGTLKAVHISLAQIWRDDVKKTIGEKLQSVGGDGVVPYCSTRKGLTLAERVFGFVQGDPSLNGGDEPGRDRPVAFASKLIVSDALLTKVPTNGIYLSKHAETLKILSSPKPPSPAFYFDPVSGHLPDYEQIKNGDSHPRGRKMYLHLHPESADKKPWLTKRPNYLADGSARLDQKVAIECLNKDSIFEFTIDFDNLTTAELAALCYSLRPKDRFMHKIGLAKPLGLGSIAFEVQRVEKIDRSRRYTSPGFAETRYCDIAETPVSWIAKRADAWKSYFLEKAPDCANSLTAFETIGTTAVDSLHYPLLRNQPDAEDELFKWPSENRQIASMPAMNGYSQFLRKVDADLSIDPLPWPCNILVLKGGANLAGSFIESLKNSCSGYVALTDATGAKGKIDEFRSKCAGCLTFVIGTITTLAGIVDEPSRVKRVQLADVAIQRPARNIEKRYWNDDHKTLSNLERALKLGAK